MLNGLQLLSGNDIPIESIRIIMHQPTIKEIGYIGEDVFFSGCEFLRFSKDNLKSEDRVHLENISNFEVIMSIIKEKNPVVIRNRINMQLVLSLLFPTYEIHLDTDKLQIILKQNDNEFIIDKENYDDFKNIMNEVLCLGGGESDFNPSGDMARRIADKLRNRHKKDAESKENQQVAILSRYVSILAVGENKDINDLLRYTIYQLFDEFKRYQLKLNWDIHLKAQLAGAKDLKEVEDWMKDIHSDVDDDQSF